ncbi:unnamed protein product [Musa acuminata var. zebrina]
MFTSSTGVFKSNGRCLRKTLAKVTGTDDIDPPQTSCPSIDCWGTFSLKLFFGTNSMPATLSFHQRKMTVERERESYIMLFMSVK